MIVIHNTTVVTVNGQDTIHYDAAVAVGDDRIVAVGPSAEIVARYRQADLVDGTGKAVLPGFANTHTHLGLTLARGIFEDMSLPNVPPFETSGRLPLPQVTAEENAVMCQLGALEALRSGTTAILEDGIDIDSYADRLRGRRR
jgi:5-methylthioadenosine/S-adenosylhomocysteine deaminase